MGTIFKYKNKYIQCRNLEKKLKKLKINKEDIEIIKDNIPNESLELEFVNLTRKEKIEKDPDIVKYYIFKNSKGNYLLGINKPDLTYIKKFGYNVSDYELIDTCTYPIPEKYMKWNPETKTGIKWQNQ